MKIYMASPFGFTEITNHFMEIVEDSLIKIGYEVINPWRLNNILPITQITIKSNDRATLSQSNIKIGHNNEIAIRNCDLVLAFLEGCDIDSGTASEVGFAYGIGKQIIGYRNDKRKLGENAGCIVNLQLQYWIEQSNGFILSSKKELLEYFTKLEKKGK